MYPIRTSHWNADLFARLLAGGEVRNDSDALKVDLLEHGRFLPIGKFISRNRHRLQPGKKAIPVLVRDEQSWPWLWIGVDPITRRIGVGWVILDAPLMLEYGKIDLGFRAQPPRGFPPLRVAYRWWRRKLHSRYRRIQFAYC